MLFLLLSVGRVGARVEPGQVVVLGRHDGAGDQQGGAGKKIRKQPQILRKKVRKQLKVFSSPRSLLKV